MAIDRLFRSMTLPLLTSIFGTKMPLSQDRGSDVIYLDRWRGPPREWPTDPRTLTSARSTATATKAADGKSETGSPPTPGLPALLPVASRSASRCRWGKQCGHNVTKITECDCHTTQYAPSADSGAETLPRAPVDTNTSQGGALRDWHLLGTCPATSSTAAA